MQKTTHVGKNVESFYKYKLFQSDNIVVTLQPKFHYSTYNDSSTYNADLGVFLGHSHEGKKHTSFQEIGIIARNIGVRESKTLLVMHFLCSGF